MFTLTRAGRGMHDWCARRPAGHHTYQASTPPARQQPVRGPLDTGLSGTGRVADDLYLICHDDRTGKPLLQPRQLGIGLAGALLAELMLARCIGLRPDGAVMTGGNMPAKAAAGHLLLQQIACKPGLHPVREWLLFLARTAPGEVAVRLERAGYLTRVRSRVPGRPGRWVPVDPDWAFAPMLRVRSALDPARAADDRSAVLAGLTVASGLGFRLDQYQTPAGRSVQDATGQLAPGLRELITATQAAVDSAVLSHHT